MTAPRGSGGAGASEAEVVAAMRAFEKFSTVLRYREAEKWHLNDVTGMRAALDAAAAARPAPAGEASEVVAPDDLRSSEFGRDLFRSVIGDSYKPHVWDNHRALHHTSVRFALDMADQSMPEVADVLRAMIWRQVIVDNRAIHARQAERKAEDRATAAEADNARLRAMLAASDASCPYCGPTAADMAKCASGSPGCGRADDMPADAPEGPPEPAEVDRSGDDAVPELAAAEFDPAQDRQSGFSLFESTADITISDNGLATKNSGESTGPTPAAGMGEDV